MQLRHICVLSMILLVGNACTHFTPPTQVKRFDPKTQGYWFQYAAERRGATSVPSEGNASGMMICAEPAPDIALEHTSSVLANVNIPQTADAELKAEFASQVIQLAGRTQTVLLLREAMYRLCEQSLNGNLTQAQVAKLFEKVLETTVLMGQADAMSSGARLEPDTKARQQILDLIGAADR